MDRGIKKMIKWIATNWFTTIVIVYDVPTDTWIGTATSQHGSIKTTAVDQNLDVMMLNLYNQVKHYLNGGKNGSK